MAKSKTEKGRVARVKSRPSLDVSIREARIVTQEISGLLVEMKKSASRKEVFMAGICIYDACEIVWAINQYGKELAECTPEQARELDRIALHLEKVKDEAAEFITSKYWR